MIRIRPLAACLLSVMVAAPGLAQTVHLVGAGHFATIQAAIDAAAAGDVVLVDAGVYPTFHVGKPLTITAVPSALVQVVGTGPITFSLLPPHRVHLGGLDIHAGGFRIHGGIVSAERCTVFTDRGMELFACMLSLRWSAAGAAHGSGVLVRNAHLHASDSTLSTAAGGNDNAMHAALKVEGAGTCQLSLCTLLGAWPASATAPLPSAALHVSAVAGANPRIWIGDCTLIGGLGHSGGFGPTIIAPPLPAPAPVRLHRCQTWGPVTGAVSFGPVVGLHTPVDLQIGATFTTRMLGEPGHPLLLYSGTDILGPFPILEVEQPALGFFDTVILGTIAGDAQGVADFPLVVPNNLALRHSVLWWRGLDLGTWPWQATPAFVTIVQ